MESLTRPLFHHRRKVSNACSSRSSSSNGLSFSGKDAYDDVFAGVPKPKFGAASSFVASSRKVAAQDYAEIFCGKNGTRGSSIPVLDLSDLEERNGSDDFRSSNGKVDYSMIFGGSGVGDDGATAVPPFEEIFNGAKRGKTDKAKARIPADLGSPLKGSDHFNSSENKKGHSSEASDQLFDGGKQFNMSYHKISQRVKDGSNGTTHIAQLHAVPGFTNVIDETAHLQTEQIKATPPVKTKVNHSRSTSDHLQRREQVKAIPPVKAEVNHTRSSSDRLQKTEQDKAIPTVKAEVNENRNSSDCPQKTEQDMAIPPVKVEVNHNRSSSDDTSDGKSGRRAKWQLPTMQASKGLVTDNGECNGDASCSMEFKLYNANELDMKSHPSKVPPPFGFSANLISSKGHPKRSKSSNVSPKVEASEKVAGGYSTPFSDEELDVNSAAAASAAALKKAIEQAQESIRIAKEIMERKRDSVQSSKSRSMGSLKAKDRREIRYVEEADNIRENNVKEASESVAKEVQDFIGIDQEVSFGDGEVASTFEKREKPSTGRQAEVEMNGENIEVADDNGVAMWFTQLLNNGKHRMAALASELVGKKNSILQPVDKDIHDTEETKPAKVTFGWDTTEQVNPFDRIFEFGNIETKLNAPERAEELEKDVDNPDSSQFAHEKNVSETLMFVQENEVTNNTQQGSDKEENCKENLEYTHEIVSDRRVELKKSGDGLPENELLKLEEKSFGQEAEKILEDFHVWEENDCRVDEEEIDKQQEELHNCVGIDDDPKFAAGCVSNGKQQEDDPEERLEGYHKQTTYEPRSTQSVDGEENQIMSEEEHVWEEIDRRPAGTYQKEEADMKDEYAVNSSANEKIEVNEKIQELCNTRAATEEIAEIPLENLFQEAVYRESLNTAFGADNIDQSANVGDIQEAARCEVESGNEQTSELDTRNHEEKGNLAGFTEQTSQQEGRNNEKACIDVSESFYEFEGDAKAQQAVEEASRLKGKQITETSFLDHADAQENTMETDIQDVSEAVACDDKTSFGFIEINHEAGLSNDTEMAETTGFIHHGAKDDAMYNEDATEAPSAVKSSSNFNFTVINGHKQIHENNIEFESSINIGIDSRFVHEVYGQKQVEENDRESESADEPEYGDGLVHDSGGNAENVKVNGIASDKGIEKDNIEICDKEIEGISTEKELESSQFARELKREEHVETNTEMKTGQVTRDNEENVCKTFVKEEKETAETVQKEEAGKDYLKRTEVNKREREREKDRIAVERAIREARERAFAEARERAERAAVEKATAEVRQRAMTEAREKLEKVSASTKVPTDKASIEAKLRAERAAVERATAEARERALEKALSQKTTSETRMQAERNGSGKVSGASRDTGLKHSFPSSDLERCDGTNNESTQRRKARLERHQRIMERASKALAEKNLRDVLAQREQAERNRLAETLDADIKRWASGKEGNLRALLSTLQYILGPGSGWQPISLTEIITTDGVRKAYRKATLYVHPDKLQQRGASIQQKYICEKVFDLLKAAWNRFNSAER